MIIEGLHREIDKNWSSHLRQTRNVLRVPSVSMTGEGMEESASLLEDLLTDLGVKPGRFKANRKSFPLITGHLDVGAEKTALLYGMYDVQPAEDPSGWWAPPFAAKIINKKPYGEILVNRGAYNSKGSLVGTLLAIKTMMDRGEMPLNIRFLLEGEEELGGLSLPNYVRNNRSTLSKADVALGMDYNENSKGIPVLSLGMKGCVFFDLIADGRGHGGPDNEIHSSDAVWVQSPVWRLVKAISTMVDDNQVPTVDGLWDNVIGPDKDDLNLIRKLVKRVDLKAYRDDLGIKAFKLKGSTEDLVKSYLFDPSLNIAGLEAGYYGEGTKTILPARAIAKIDIRTAPNMTIADTRQKVRKHLDRRGFTDIMIRNYEDYPWTKVSVREDISQACIDAMRYHGKDPEVWPMVAGSAPFYLFNDVLGIPWGGVGLGFGGNAHAPNEFATVEGMKDFEKSVVTVMWKYAEISKKKR